MVEVTRRNEGKKRDNKTRRMYRNEYVEEEEEEENGPCVARTQDTGKEYPRIVEDASLPSPSFSCPFYGSLFSLSSSSSTLFPGCKYAPLCPIRTYSSQRESSPTSATPRRGYRHQGTSFFPYSNGFRRGSFFLSLSPSFHTPQDFDTDCEIKSSPKSPK